MAVKAAAKRKSGRTEELNVGWQPGERVLHGLLLEAILKDNPIPACVPDELHRQFLCRPAGGDDGEVVQADALGMDRAVLPDPATAAERPADQHRDRTAENQHCERGEAFAEEGTDHAQDRYRRQPPARPALERFRTTHLHRDHRQLHRPRKSHAGNARSGRSGANSSGCSARSSRLRMRGPSRIEGSVLAGGRDEDKQKPRHRCRGFAFLA